MLPDGGLYHPGFDVWWAQSTTHLIGIGLRSVGSIPPPPISLGSEGPVGIAFGKSNDAAGGSRTYELSHKHTSKLQLPIMIYKFFEATIANYDLQVF